MNPNRGSFPKSTTPETIEQKRERFEAWMIATADGDIPDPELAAILAQPGRDTSRRKFDYVYIVRARCWQCIGGAEDSGARDRIEQCALSSCALHAVRPYRRADEQTGAVLARRPRCAAHCRDCQGGPKGGPTVARAIAECGVVNCAIWPARPISISIAPKNGVYTEFAAIPSQSGEEIDGGELLG